MNPQTKEAALTHVAIRNINDHQSASYGLKPELEVDGTVYLVTTIGSYDSKGNGISIYDKDAAELPADGTYNTFYFSYFSMAAGSGGYVYPKKITVCQNAFENFNGQILFPDKDIELTWGAKEDGSLGSAVSADFSGCIVDNEKIKEALGADAGYYRTYLSYASYPEVVYNGEKLIVKVSKDGWSPFVDMKAEFKSESQYMSFPYSSLPEKYGVVSYTIPYNFGTAIEMEKAGEDAQGNIILSSKDEVPSGFGVISLLIQSSPTLDNDCMLLVPFEKKDPARSELIELKDGKYNYDCIG